MKLFLLISFATISLTENVKNLHFTADVYRELLKHNSGTFLACPLSAKIALALVQLGAGGKTAQQLSTGLQFTANSRRVLQKYMNKLLPHLQSNKDYQLKSANIIYVQNGFSIKPQYRTVAINAFKSDIQYIDFGNSQKAASDMNKWIEDHTNHKIKNMVNAGDIDSLVVLAIINAMYFHGKWVNKFNKERTTKKEFFLQYNKKIDIDMMSLTAKFNFYRNYNLSAKFLEMPYKGNDVTMTFVLPDNIEGLPALEAHIVDVLNEPNYSLKPIDVVLPKFKVETKIDFKPILQALGIRDAFHAGANFSGITNTPGLYVSTVLQNAFIEVDEEGTTAAAVTMAFLHARSRPLRQSFNANHPFIFYLKVKGVIMFIGRYVGSK